METKVITAHIPIPLSEKLEELSDRIDRSKGWIFKQALTDYVNQEEERHLMTLEALEDIRAGRVVPHEAVQAWADSLDTENPKKVPYSCK